MGNVLTILVETQQIAMGIKTAKKHAKIRKLCLVVASLNSLGAVWLETLSSDPNVKTHFCV